MGLGGDRVALSYRMHSVKEGHHSTLALWYICRQGYFRDAIPPEGKDILEQ